VCVQGRHRVLVLSPAALRLYTEARPAGPAVGAAGAGGEQALVAGLAQAFPHGVPEHLLDDW
jgi:hypothetical protein